MPIVKELLKLALALVLIALSSAWLMSLDWLTGDSLTTTPAGRDEIAETFVSRADLSSSGHRFLSLIRGASTVESPLLLHQLGSSIQTQPIATGESDIWCTTLVPDGSAAVVLGGSRRVTRIEFSRNVQTPLFTVPPRANVADLAVSPDGAILAIALDAEVVLCDAMKGGEIGRLSGAKSPISELEFSGDGRLLAFGCEDGTVRLWERTQAAPRYTIASHHGRVSCVRFFDSDRKIATSGLADDLFCVCNVATGRELLRTRAEQSGIRSLAVSPDGSLAATGGLDNRIRLWDLSGDMPPRDLAAQCGVVCALHFRRDGTGLIAAAATTIRSWGADYSIPEWEFNVGATDSREQ